MKNQNPLHEEAGKLLKDLQFIPEIGAMCRGENLRVWLTFNRIGSSRAGKITVRTQPPLPRMHFRLTQSHAAGEVVREAFTDSTGSALLEYLLGDLPCSARLLEPAIELSGTVPGPVPEKYENFAAESHLALAAQGDDPDSTAKTARFEPRSWQWSQPRLNISIADTGAGELAMAVESEDRAMAGKSVRIHLGKTPVEVKLDPLPDFPGVFGGMAPIPLSLESAAVIEVTQVETLNG